jgi:hypothetical protein
VLPETGMSSDTPLALTASALEVLAYEFNGSLGLRGDYGAPHAHVVCASVLADPRLDSTACLFWVRYLWLGILVKSETVESVPGVCISLATRLLSRDSPSMPADAKLADELGVEGTTADLFAPIVLRFLQSSGVAQPFGRSTAAMTCALLVIDYHRLIVPRGGDARLAVTDLLRILDLCMLNESEPMLTYTAAVLVASLTEFVQALLSDAVLLTSAVRSISVVFPAATALSTGGWGINNAITTVARVLCSLVSASDEAAEAALSVTANGLHGGSSAVEAGDASASSLQASAKPAAKTVLAALLHYLIAIVPSMGRLRASRSVLRAAHSCLEAVAAMACHSDAAEALRGQLPALLAA